MKKSKSKQNKLEKPFYHVDNRKKAKKQPKTKEKERFCIEYSKIDGSISKYIDEDYLDWIRSSVGCLICGRVSIPHHLTGRRVARLDVPVKKDSGEVWGGVVALCNDRHHINDSPVGVHRLGKESFQGMFGINLQDEAVKLYEKYLKEKK